jgi:hypothetical protein
MKRFRAATFVFLALGTMLSPSSASAACITPCENICWRTCYATCKYLPTGECLSCSVYGCGFGVKDSLTLPVASSSNASKAATGTSTEPNETLWNEITAAAPQR